MAKEYIQEELWKLYEKLPEELKEAVFAEETADNIFDICTRNGIEDERISEIARYTGHVLLGILSPDEFQETLEKEVKLKKEIAKKIAQEINRFIFLPVKESLAALYKVEITSPAAPPITPQVKPSEEITPPAEAVSPPSEKKPKREDIYREPIE